MAPSCLFPGTLLLFVVGCQLLASPLEPYDYLYDSGVEAYQRGDWSSVILAMEKALRNRELIRRHQIGCRTQCANQSDFSGQPAGWGPVQDLSFFRSVMSRAECLKRCEQDRLGGPSSSFQASEEMELEFKKRTPYNYLQVAYFKAGMCRIIHVLTRPGERLPQAPEMMLLAPTFFDGMINKSCCQK